MSALHSTALKLRTAVIGVGSLGRQHARIHAALAAEGQSSFVAVCDTNEETARSVAEERGTKWTTDWRTLVGDVDAVSLATPTESHAEIACALLEAGVHVLVEKPISRTIDEADAMTAAAERGKATLMVGHLERFNPALVALRPHVRNPVYFEIHRVGQFTARSLDIDVVLDLMIHDLDIVLWLVGGEAEVTDVRAVGLPVLTNRVDAANARIEFSTGAVANITASRVGTEKIRKMRFFQPHDYIAVDYATRRASISSLAPPSATGSWPGVQVRNLDIVDVEPLRSEIELFLEAAREGRHAPVTGEDGRRALALAGRLLARIHEHPIISGLKMQF
ncbi:MAG TPA: Gfo/Idh/MocA family oxidoreductase [Pyrinomonadaceae bacterium]|jgi:predicted dehydrogenase|nr:Gfo/Idh/MocA family oxidoreductase [Pyrinomonadaceae bacterium]